jgi:hypothetical protein
MYSRTVKVISLAALVLAAALTLRGAPQILMQLLVCGGAMFVMMEAFRNHKYIWVAAFAVPVICFNPVFPLVLSRSASRAMVFFCGLAFLASLRYLHPKLRMSLATITDLPARGESL